MLYYVIDFQKKKLNLPVKYAINPRFDINCDLTDKVMLISSEKDSTTSGSSACPHLLSKRRECSVTVRTSLHSCSPCITPGWAGGRLKPTREDGVCNIACGGALTPDGEIQKGQPDSPSVSRSDGPAAINRTAATAPVVLRVAHIVQVAPSGDLLRPRIPLWLNFFVVNIDCRRRRRRRAAAALWSRNLDDGVATEPSGLDWKKKRNIIHWCGKEDDPAENGGGNNRKEKSVSLTRKIYDRRDCCGGWKEEEKKSPRRMCRYRISGSHFLPASRKTAGRVMTPRKKWGPSHICFFKNSIRLVEYHLPVLYTNATDNDRWWRMDRVQEFLMTIDRYYINWPVVI